MPANQQAKLGNWIHRHCHPVMPAGYFKRVAFSGAFFISRGQVKSLRAAQGIS